MEPTSQTNILRSILMFVIIGAILLVSIFFGVRFAKSRSDSIAKKEPNITSAAKESSSNQNQNNKDSNSSSQRKDIATSNQPVSSPSLSEPSAVNKDNPKTEANNKAPQALSPQQPSAVPSTGASDFLPIFAIAATVFATATYVQSRRRLSRLCL